MNYTKKRKIQEANMLLERRYLLTEVEKYDKAIPNENQWYTAQDPNSVKNPKGFRIFVKKFGQNPIDPIKDQEFVEFKNYFVEYPTQQDADTKFNEFYNKLITKQTAPQQNDSTTTTTTLKPGTTPSVAERLPVYNNKERGHDALFRNVATHHFSEMLDDVIGPEWRIQREEEPDIEQSQMKDPNNLDAWFGRD